MGSLVFGISILWVLTEAYLAWRDGTLTSKQMVRLYHYHRVMPFACHGGMWGDLLFISPLMGVIVGTYGADWNRGEVLSLAVVGTGLSLIMHATYIKSPIPDSLAWKSGISAAGWMHVVYMAAAFTIIGLLYFGTAEVSLEFLLITDLVLIVHLIFGTHIVLGVLDKHYHWLWCPKGLLTNAAPWTTLAAATLALTVMTALAI